MQKKKKENCQGAKPKRMTLARALEILSAYQLWRKGVGPYSWDGQSRDVPPSFFDAYSTRDIGDALDYAISALKTISERRASARATTRKEPTNG